MGLEYLDEDEPEPIAADPPPGINPEEGLSDPAVTIDAVTGQKHRQPVPGRDFPSPDTALAVVTRVHTF